MRVLVVVPAYDEEANLPGLLRELRRMPLSLEVVVVNDSSRDATAQVARRHGARVINLPINLGIGGAVQTGLRYGWKRGYDVCLQVDGDGQHDPADIPALPAPLRSGEADCVVGSRFCHGGNRGYRSTFARQMGIRILSALLWLLSGQRVLDVTSGFRAVNRRAMGLLASSYPDDYPEPESLLSLMLAGLRVKEAPVTMRGRHGGRSSIRISHAWLYMVKVSLALLICRVRSWLNPSRPPEEGA